MSTTPIIDEYIYEMTRALGDAYLAIVDGIGDITQPGSALFEIAQINDLANKNAPYFGILRNCEPSDINYWDNRAFKILVEDINIPEILVTSGSVSYNNQVIEVKEQILKYGRDFANYYPEDYVYGVVLGLPLSEIQNMTNIHSTLVSETSQSYTLKVDNVQIAINLGFPLSAYVGSEYIIFIGVDGENNLVVDSSTLGFTVTHRRGTQVYFIYQPRVKALCGLPVAQEYQSGQNVKTFAYYPPIPDSWLSIAKFLVRNPNRPQIINKIINPSPVVAVTTQENDVPFSSYSGQKITTSSSVVSIDGVTLSIGQRILIKDYTGSHKKYNGIYSVSSSTEFIRTLDADTSDDLSSGFIINVSHGGNLNGDKSFVFISPIPFVLDTSDVIFELYSTENIDTGELQYAIQDLVIDWPYGSDLTPIFTSDDAAQISSTAESLAISLTDILNNIYFNDVIQGLEAYTKTISDNPSTSFKAFWSNRPFKPNTYFAKGISFDNLERFEFPDSFIRAYYDFMGKDLQHTFAVFRGDMVQQINYNAPWGNPPVPFEITSCLTNTVPSTLQKGTYIYTKTLNVQNTEQLPVYLQKISDTFQSYVNEIKGTDSSDSNTYYHIYRRTNLVGDQIEYRLTGENEVKTLKVADSPGFELSSSSGYVLNPDVYHLIYYHLLNDFDSLCGGIEIYLRFDENSEIYNGDDKLDIYLSEIKKVSCSDAVNNVLICNGHGLLEDEAILFITTYGGFDIARTYYVISDSYLTTNTFRVSEIRSGSGFNITGTFSDTDNKFYSVEDSTLESNMGTPIYYRSIMASDNFTRSLSKFNTNNFLVDSEYWIILKQSDYAKTNNIDVVGESSSNLLITSTPHNLVTDDMLKFIDTSGGFDLEAIYYVISTDLSEYHFKVSTSIGGVEFDINEDFLSGINQFYKIISLKLQHSATNSSDAKLSQLDISNNISGYSEIDNYETKLIFYGYIDNGMNTGTVVSHRGVRLTGAKALVSTQLRVYVPPIELPVVEPFARMTYETLGIDSTTETRNELIVIVTAQNGENGIPVTLPRVVVPANTPRGTSFAIGNRQNIFDRVVDVTILPGTVLRRSQNRINWSIYDLITIETMP
jgi:hypothetical protein